MSLFLLRCIKRDMDEIYVFPLVNFRHNKYLTLSCVMSICLSRGFWNRGKGGCIGEDFILPLKELHVRPHSLLLVRVTQQIRRMEGRQNRNPVIVMKSPA